MFRKCAMLALTLFFVMTSFNNEAVAAVKKKKNKRTTDSKYVNSNKKSKRKSSNRYARNSKSRRHRGSSVDLKALTTESPYTENTDNGVNPVETKPGIQ